MAAPPGLGPHGRRRRGPSKKPPEVGKPPAGLGAGEGLRGRARGTGVGVAGGALEQTGKRASSVWSSLGKFYLEASMTL